VPSRRVGILTVEPGFSVAARAGLSTVTAEPESGVTVVVLAPIETVKRRP
jgi:hypothetical protein